MSSYRLVSFRPEGVRISYTNDITPFLDDPNVLINPELPKGVPPHKWTLQNGKIVVSQTDTSAPHILRKSRIREFYFAAGTLVGSTITAFIYWLVVRG